MINTNNMLSTGAQRLDFVGWKAYKEIKKKAMEQKFSWSGLLISMSIAFFVVIMSAYFLHTVYLSFEKTKKHEIFLNQKIYQLEDGKLLNEKAINNLKKSDINFTCLS